MEKPTGKKWDAVVQVAQYLTLGYSQRAVSKMPGMPSEATISKWKRQPWWREAEAIAHQDWASEAIVQAKANVLTAIAEGDLSTSKWLLGLVDENFYNPAVRHKIEKDRAEARPSTDSVEDYDDETLIRLVVNNAQGS